MVKYLRPGQDFSFPAGFGFSLSASRKGGSMPDTNRAESVRVRSGTNFEAQDPRSMDATDRSYRGMENDEIAREPKAKGGPIRRAEGGSSDSNWSDDQQRADLERMNDEDIQAIRRRYDPKKFVVDDDRARNAKGGPIRRAIGGVIPGNAPAAGMEPMTAPPSAAPMAGNPLSRVQVSMPASDLALLARGAAKIGAGQAVGGLTQAARNRTGAQPVRMPGAAAIAPAAAPPPPVSPMQGMAGVRPQGMKDGGHLTAKARHALPSKDFALPGERYPIPDKNHARAALSRASADASPAEQTRIRGAVHRKFPGIGRKG